MVRSLLITRLNLRAHESEGLSSVRTSFVCMNEGRTAYLVSRCLYCVTLPLLMCPEVNG